MASLQSVHRSMMIASSVGRCSHANSLASKTAAPGRLLSSLLEPRLKTKLVLRNHGPRTNQRRSFTQEKAESSSKGRSFSEWYEHHLEESPVLTKAVTGSILWGIGDGVAQLVPHFAFSDSDDTAQAGSFEYDLPRTGRAVAFGGLLHAPTSHVHFNFLEWMTNRVGATGLVIPVFKTVMEQFVYWSWISNSMYHGFMGAMQGFTPTQIYDRIADVLWDTQKAQWAFWIPVQLLNFRFVPIRHQLNVVLCTSIVWTALLSMWYPPVKEEAPVETPKEQ